jgi:glutamate 5-kinase
VYLLDYPDRKGLQTVRIFIASLLNGANFILLRKRHTTLIHTASYLLRFPLKIIPVFYENDTINFSPLPLYGQGSIIISPKNEKNGKL